MPYTTGPWKFINNGMIVKYNESAVVGTFHADNSNKNKNEDRALIVAAPELLEALRDITREVESRAPDRDYRLERAAKSARATLAKIEI